MASRVVVIVQARMASTRLPGKVLKEVMDKPLLSYLVERIRRASAIDDIVIATTTSKQDDVIVDFCNANQLQYFRGSENDVLSRYFGAATQSRADNIVRICSDSPLIDPVLLDEIVGEFTSKQPACDYLSNTINQTYPLGMNMEAFTMASLSEANDKAASVYEREHVTPYIYFHPEKFKIIQKHNSQDLSKIRLTVDEQADFDLVKLIIEALYPANPSFTLNDILALLQQRPELININAHIWQTKVEKPPII